MGQKVNPVGFRLGVINTWDSIWYADRGYADKLHQDLKIRQYITSSFAIAGISKVKIERLAKKVRVIIKSARPGMIIGKKGEDIAKIKSMIEKITTDEVVLNIVDVKKAEIDANLVATSVAQQLERRTAFRKAAKRAIQSAMRLGAKGVRLNISGRLGGAEIARTQWYKEGRVPLHTLRAKIGYACASAHTTYGVLGVKVWIYRGERVSSDGLYDD